MGKIIGRGRYATDVYPDPPKASSGQGGLLAIADALQTATQIIADGPSSGFLLKDEAKPATTPFWSACSPLGRPATFFA